LIATLPRPVDDRRSELVVEHLGLVRSIAARFFNRGEPIDDLRQVGAIGLLKAADRFDDRCGVAFTTYAFAKIAGEIRHHCRDNSNTVRLPRKSQALALQIERLRDSLQSAARPHVKDSDIAAKLGVTEKAIRSASDLWNLGRPLSLDAVMAVGNKPLSDQKVLGSVDADIERFEVRTDVSNACETLDDHERLIVRLRFFEEMTQRAVGKIIGKSQMYVCRVEKQAIKKLRTQFGPRPSSVRNDWAATSPANDHLAPPFGARLASAEG